MAIYELQCKKCDHLYDIQSLMAEQDANTKRAKCPECGSKSKERMIGSISFAFGDPIGTDRYNNSHDYRFHHKMNEGGVKANRKAAEAASKVGNNPYPHIDDVSSGKHFGEVK